MPSEPNESTEQPAPAISSPGESPAQPTKAPKAKKPKPQRLLPTDRMALSKQVDLLRAYGSLSQSGAPVANGKVAEVVELHPSTVSLANAFLVEVGLLIRGADGLVPNADVVAFARAHDWNSETAPQKLAPTMRAAWFGAALLPRVKFRQQTKQEALAVLAEAAAAGTEHKGQLESLLELMEIAGLVSIDGDSVRAGRAAVGDEPSSNKPKEERKESDGEREDGDPNTQVLRVPKDFIVYRCKLSGGRVIEIPLPPSFNKADTERLYAFLKTQMDDETESP